MEGIGMIEIEIRNINNDIVGTKKFLKLFLITMHLNH